jgi:hypothetical protein
MKLGNFKQWVLRVARQNPRNAFHAESAQSTPQPHTYLAQKRWNNGHVGNPVHQQMVVEEKKTTVATATFSSFQFCK